MRKLLGRAGTWTWYITIIVIMIILPIFMPAFWISLLTEILIMGLAGMSVNLLLGFGGSLPFGHAAFFASGAYATAILLQKANLPFIAAMVIAPIIAAAIGAVFGLIITRLYQFYYGMMSAALCMVLWTVIRKWTVMTGGDNGITGIEIPELLNGIYPAYALTAIIVSGSLIFLRYLVNSPFGWIQQAVRENPTRVTFTGINVLKHRYISFIISSYFCGIAGMLFVIYSHSTFPEYSHWVKSGDMVMICILGGMYSFIGPMVGAGVLTILQTFITSITLYWPMVLGFIICIIVIFMPKGVLGLVEDLRVKRRGL